MDDVETSLSYIRSISRETQAVLTRRYSRHLKRAVEIGKSIIRKEKIYLLTCLIFLTEIKVYYKQDGQQLIMIRKHHSK